MSASRAATGWSSTGPCLAYCSLSTLWPSQLLTPLAAGLVGAVEELHEAHTLLDESPSEDAVPGEGGLERVLRVVCAVRPQHVLRLGGNVAHLRHAHLHARRQLVAGDARRKFRLTRVTLEMALIHPPEKGASRLVGGARNGFRARKVVDRFGGVKGRPLECRWQKTGSPAVDARLGRAARVGDGDVRREVVVLAAQSVTGPSSHAREPLQRGAGAHVIFGRAVRVRFAGERVDEAQLVRHLPDVWN